MVSDQFEIRQILCWAIDLVYMAVITKFVDITLELRALHSSTPAILTCLFTTSERRKEILVSPLFK